MRKCLLGVSAFLLLASGAYAASSMTAPPKLAAVASSESRPPAAIQVGLTTETSAISPGQIADCANLAALRALDARSAGSGFDVQRRVLSVTFVLCLAGQGNAMTR
ncbi:MAG TPA: hypothetical protein VII56_00615 [Rhizomicrobium sp.]